MDSIDLGSFSSPHQKSENMTVELVQKFEYSNKFIFCLFVNNSFVFSTDLGLLIIVRINCAYKMFYLIACLLLNTNNSSIYCTILSCRKFNQIFSDRLPITRFFDRHSRFLKRSHLKTRISTVLNSKEV